MDSLVELELEQERELLKNMDFEEFFKYSYGMTVAEFKNMHKSISPERKGRWRELHPYDSYTYTYDEHVDKAVKCVYERYIRMRDKEIWRDKEMTFLYWLRIYHGHTPESWKAMMLATGSYKDYVKSFRDLKKSYEQHQLGVNPFV